MPPQSGPGPHVAPPAQPGPGPHVAPPQPSGPGPHVAPPGPGPHVAPPQPPGPGPHVAPPAQPGPGPHVAPPTQQSGPGPQVAPQQPGPGPQAVPAQPGPGPRAMSPQPGPGLHAAPPQPGPQPGPQHGGQPGAYPGPLPPQPIPPTQGQPPQHPGPQHPGPQQPNPYQPGPPAPWTGNGQPPRPVAGPYPPAVVPPHGAEQPPGPNPPPVDPYQQLPWVSDGTPTAEEFARRRLAKPAEPVATMGARALVQKGTMGLVRLAPGKREQEYKQDVEMVRRNFGGLRQVTVVNPKGGAGKTVAVLLLAMTFGQKRGGYVLAWDNNETQGTLGMRAQQDFHARTVRDMMRDLHLFRGSHGRVGDLSQYVRAQGEGMFDVLASDESATAGEMLTASAFAEIREIVSRFYKLIFVDTGNNVRAQNWQAAMDATDQLVITMSARNDSAETAARMLDHLEQSGRQRLVRQAVSVVTMPPTRKDIDLPAIQRHFAARTRAVLLAPYEKLIDSGEPLRYGQLSSGTRDSWLKIAAAVAEGL
ncbi:chromosome partitioning protein [Couchioplanes caeruleus]|uniref:chromosome partitioning protein n=1 Tax=Couchioplanes caeruleus TaxID=56438 RepID=UPI0020BFB0B2|nr:chromosome partitioning protein [Couchioplanes caeruleus]UQU68315.1 chromosome partitioning protein [Couchioplanes caeruleus]